LAQQSWHYYQEAGMANYTEGTVAHLQGDLTHSGVTDNIVNSLAASLMNVDSEVEKNIRIDCGKIHTADISGLQLLYVWMQCARFRGVESQLVNMTAGLQQIMLRMGFGHCFTGNSTLQETV
jgi:anti-anti-sigma regulatory factor